MKGYLSSSGRVVVVRHTIKALGTTALEPQKALYNTAFTG